ncbi:unnamed protein product [Bursaphelenchus okinawaensis]|uniref:Uncharacterized protein n=1 Tax=Bursaphelenchus okinawaensis TaxID=465554 RepID=A0A811LJS9_9BILA|nr:unnamed protein product [Bursaphelenchus okinawaensis]CAG9123763.1 unnamed protein product [Bursaphelenchus okinawaensis]
MAGIWLLLLLTLTPVFAADADATTPSTNASVKIEPKAEPLIEAANFKRKPVFRDPPPRDMSVLKLKKSGVRLLSPKAEDMAKLSETTTTDAPSTDNTTVVPSSGVFGVGSGTVFLVSLASLLLQAMAFNL